jgi:cell division septation protein DedD
MNDNSGSNIEESEFGFDRSFIEPRRGMHNGLKLLIGAVVLSGAVIAAIASGYVNQDSSTSLVQAEPASDADKDVGIATPPQQTVGGSELIPEIATISLASGSPLPAEIEQPLSAVQIQGENQIASADSTAWRIQLFSLSNQNNTGASWTRLQQTNPDLLDSLTLHVEPAELSNGTFYRVQAGPVLDKVAAVSLCNALKSRNQECLVVAP